MNQNAMAITVLCSHLCMGEEVKPFEPSEWTKLADRLLAYKYQPCDLLSFTDDDFKSKLDFNGDEVQRINRLMGRSGSIAFEIERYANRGIHIMTRADDIYPKALKKKLGKACPPLFYYAGDPHISDKKSIGFVGSRSIGSDDEKFTAAIVNKINAAGFAVVSGGAKGVDTLSSDISINNGNFSIAYISDSFTNKIKPKLIINAILNNQLLILSAAKPDAGFSVGTAMMRNSYIYAQSEGTVIVKADYHKGGTWHGAVANLKKRWCPAFCWNNPAYEGNMALIEQGVVPIDETWTGALSGYNTVKAQKAEQLTLFES